MPNIRKWLELSTGHITPKVRDLFVESSTDILDRLEVSVRDDLQFETDLDTVSPAADILIVYPHCHGWFVYAGTDEEMMKKADVPPELLYVFRYAKRHGCDWICFDQDAEEDPDLPTFDW